MPLSDTTRAAADRLVMRYPVARAALLPLLHLVQAEQGHVTDEGIAFCAERLGLTRAEVGAVSSFYTMLKREPVGDWLLSVCTNPTCKIRGAQEIYERFRDELGGHHDPDSGVSVEHAECLGICDAAPVVQVNYEMYGPLTHEEADQLLAACKKGSPPPSNWSGEVPATFREVEWELSGAADGVDDHLIAAARAQVEASVPPAYRTGETDIPVTHPGGDPMGHGGEHHRAAAGFAPPAAPSDAGLAPPAAPSDAGFGPTGVAGPGGAVAEGRPPEPGEQADADEEAGAARTEDEVAGEAEELAEQVAGQETGPTPAEQDQPATGGGDTPAEAAGDDQSPKGAGIGDERDEGADATAMESTERLDDRESEVEPPDLTVPADVHEDDGDEEPEGDDQEHG